MRVYEILPREIAERFASHLPMSDGDEVGDLRAGRLA
jgi:hypothetical protein